MRALLKNNAGARPLFFYLSQTGPQLRHGEFFDEPPANLSLEEDEFDSVDQAMDAYARLHKEVVNRGFVKATLTQELQAQLEAGSSVEDSVFVRLPAIDTDTLSCYHAELVPIFGVWPDLEVSLCDWDGTLRFCIQGRAFAVRSTDEEGGKVPLRQGTRSICCERPTTVLRTTSLQRYVMRIVFALMARRFDAVEMMVGDGKMIRPRRVGTPNPDTLGLNNDGIDQLLAHLRNAKLLGPSTLLTHPPSGGGSNHFASPLAF